MDNAVRHGYDEKRVQKIRNIYDEYNLEDYMDLEDEEFAEIPQLQLETYICEGVQRKYHTLRVPSIFIYHNEDGTFLVKNPSDINRSVPQFTIEISNCPYDDHSL